MQTVQSGPGLAVPQPPHASFAPGVDEEALRGLRATIDQAPVGIAHFDASGRFLLVNERLCTILGYERPELLTRGFDEVTFPDDIDGCRQLNERLATGAIPSYSIDKRCVRKDGSIVWAHICVSAVHRESGALAFFVATAEDVSARRAEEDQRRQAEEYLQRALEASATGTFRWDIASGVVQCRPELERLFALESAGGTRPLGDFLARVHPEDRERIGRAVTRCATEAHGFEEDCRVVWPDGSVHCVHAVGRTFRDTQGKPAYMAGACVDVTSAWQTQEKLEESEARLRALVEAAPFGISAFDSGGNPVFFNAKWAEQRGVTVEEANAGGWKSTLHPEDRDRVLASWNDAVQAGNAWTGTYRYVHPRDGKWVWVNGRSAPIRVKERLVGFVAIAVDITSLKETAAEQERLLRSEQAARMEAERAAREREDMVAIVAHDLRNPLHVIAISFAAMQTTKLSEEQRAKLLGISDRAIGSMARLLDDLLDIARIDAGRLVVQRVPVDVARLLEETREFFEANARERGIRLALGADVTSPVVGDQDRLAQVLSNLIGNALKFTQPGGHVSVLAEERADHFEFSVRDDGVGMSAEQLSHVFDRFWKGQPGSRTGAGLGLAIAKGIVHAHGGEIRAESELGNGTTIRFTIPRAVRTR